MRRMLIVGLIGVIFTACDGTGDGLDPSVDAGTDPLPLPPIPGGGTTGGSILGRLVIYVLARGIPVPDATVAIDTGAGRTVRLTDEEGRIEVRQTDLRGPATITAFVPGGPYYTLAGVDAAGVTLDLSPVTPAPPTEGFATGVVTGWSRLESDASDAVVWAEVRPIVRNLLSPTTNWPQAERPDVELAQNIVLSVAPWTSYRLRLDVTNTVGVYARAGRSASVNEAPTAFEYLAVALDPPLAAASTVTADLLLAVPLDRNLSITTLNRPALPFVAVAPYWQLPNEGQLEYATAVAVSETESAISFMAPDPAGIQDSALAAIGIGQDARGQQTIRWFRTRDAETAMPAFVDIPTPSRAGPRAMTAAGRAGDLVQWTLIKNNAPAWRMDIVGPARQSDAVWPDVVGGFDDPVTGDARVTTTSFDFGDFDPDRASFNQLSVFLTGVAFGFDDLSF